MENIVNKTWFGTVQAIFWIAFIIFPIVTGILQYHWLPNESPMLSSGEVLKPFEILSSHEECQDSDYGNNCGTVVDVWRNTNTGQVFTKKDFQVHRINERNRMTVTWFLYGLVGCLFFAGVKHYQKKDFFRYFGIAMIINLAIAAYTFLTTRVQF